MGLETTNPYGSMIWRISTKELRDKRGNAIKRRGRKQSLLRVAEENPPLNF
jgi:hypothetical protein